MIQIICLIVGIIYAIRLPKLKALTTSDFPQVPPDVFTKWQGLERESIVIFLWASWGLLLIGTPIAFVFAAAFPGGALGFQGLYLLVFLILLIFSSIPGTKAAKLKKEHNIKWP
jgi:hypothetical protein